MTDEEAVKYDPKIWNEYSKVKPPKKGWYRVQYTHVHYPGGKGLKTAWYHPGPEAHLNNFWNQEYWSHKNHAEVMFKPWEDDDSCFQNGNDHIILPIEEARIIEHCLAFFKQHHKLYNSELKVWKLLQMRIEQAEKKNEV